MLDIIIKNAIVLTMQGKGVGLIPNGAIGIKGRDIVAVDDSVLLTKEYTAEREIDAKGKIVMPGLINCHCHSDYGVMARGILTDLEYFLEQGMAGYMNTLDLEKRKAGTYAHLLEGLKHGTTTFGDMPTYCDKLAEVHEKMGTRARLSEMVREMPWDISEFLGGEYKFHRKYADEGLKATYSLLDNYGTDPGERISALVSFQALDYVSEELILEIAELARKNNTMIHTHLSQSQFEVDQSVARFGMRPVDAFEKWGILNDKTIGAHMVYNEKWENEKAAKAGVHLAACPFSWCEVGVTPPTAQFTAFGGTCGIGDDEATYTGVNPILDMKITYLNSNVDAYRNGVPTLTMGQVLRMATVESATTLGLSDYIGTLEKGKRADIIIIDTSSIAMTPTLVSPLSNIPQLLVSMATGGEVETAIVDGRIVMEDRKVLTVDEQKIIDDAQRLGQEAACDAAEYFKGLEWSEVLDRQKWYNE